MNDLKIKICGMRQAENLCEIAVLEPDFFGLIFYEKSPRNIAPAEAAKLPRFPKIKRVGVFVNEELKTIAEIAEKVNLFAVQLHGDESPEFCANLKKQNPALRIIKVFGVGANFDAARLKDYESVCDYFLFDTKTKKRGGSGEVFDWQILRKFTINKPFFLSGGISAENVGEAIAACADLPLFALDFNSRIESAAGLKSFEKAAEIFYRRTKKNNENRGEARAKNSRVS